MKSESTDREWYYGLNCVFQNIYVEVLTSSISQCKLPWTEGCCRGYTGVEWTLNKTAVLTERDTDIQRGDAT